MRTFIVVLEGTGIRLPSVPTPVVGFFATRCLRASDEATAIQSAMNWISEDWHSSELASADLAGNLTLEVKSVRRVGIVERLFSNAPQRGYTFYSK